MTKHLYVFVGLLSEVITRMKQQANAYHLLRMELLKMCIPSGSHIKAARGKTVFNKTKSSVMQFVYL